MRTFKQNITEGKITPALVKGLGFMLRNKLSQKIKSGKVRILTDTSLDESPTISPNGNVVIYATKKQDEDILAGITIDGKTKFILPSLEGETREPAWSPVLD